MFPWAAGVDGQQQAAGALQWCLVASSTSSTAVGLPEAHLGSLWFLLTGMGLHRLVGDETGCGFVSNAPHSKASHYTRKCNAPAHVYVKCPMW